MREPARVARLWAVIAVATVYAVEVGGRSAAAERPPIRGPLSLLKRGLLRIWLALLSHEPIPAATLTHHDWPNEIPAYDPLVEPYVHKG